MATGIRINNCFDVRLTDVQMDGLDIGVEVTDSTDVVMKDSHFNTRKAVVGSGVRGFKAVNVTHDDSAWSLRPTLIAVLVRRAAHGHV